MLSEFILRSIYREVLQKSIMTKSIFSITVDSENPYTQATSSTGNCASTLALKPTGRVNQSLKQRAPVVPQNSDLSPQKRNLKN